jgi:hypothetical protein
MAEHIEQVRQVSNGQDVQATRVTEDYDPALEKTHQHNVAARVVWYVAGVLLTLLALRFVLVLLGANPASGFTNFIYTASHPFVAPFFGVFSYNNLHYGVSRFEVFTILAMLVYALVAFGLARLLTLTNRGNRA